MFKLVGSAYKVLELYILLKVPTTNGQSKLIRNYFHYLWQSTGGGTAPVAGDKASLVTRASVGFEAAVANPLIAILQKRAVPQGIYGRWLDVPSDPFALLSDGSLAATGGIGSTGATSLPLEDVVTIKKLTGVRGKDFSRGTWKFSPIDSTYVTTDELNSGTGQAAFQGIRANLTGTIQGTNNTLTPCLICPSLSQVRRNPCEIVGATPLAYASPQQMINLTIGEMRRRKERPSAVA